MLCECNYTEATWNLVAASFNLPGYAQMTLADNIEGEWGRLLDWDPERKRIRNWTLSSLFGGWCGRKETEESFYAEERSVPALARLIQDAIILQN
jgi:hypothetical protein